MKDKMFDFAPRVSFAQSKVTANSFFVCSNKKVKIFSVAFKCIYNIISPYVPAKEFRMYYAKPHETFSSTIETT